MKYLPVIIILTLLCTARVGAAAERSMLARVTVYWNSPGSGERACWNGARLRAGHCAVDPRKIPYGSRVVFPDLACLAVDTGPDVVNRKAARACAKTVQEKNAIVVDRFFETKSAARSWERAHPHFMLLHVSGAEPKKHASSTVRANLAGPWSMTLSRPWLSCIFLDEPAS